MRLVPSRPHKTSSGWSSWAPMAKRVPTLKRHEMINLECGFQTFQMFQLWMRVSLSNSTKYLRGIKAANICKYYWSCSWRRLAGSPRNTPMVSTSLETATPQPFGSAMRQVNDSILLKGGFYGCQVGDCHNVAVQVHLRHSCCVLTNFGNKLV